MKPLTDYLYRVNNDPRNFMAPDTPFDLAWRWYGNGPEPEIEVYEQADRHTLCVNTPENILAAVKESLVDWDLVDPDS